MSITPPPDPAWYLDHVVVPGDVERHPVGPVRSWQGMWTHEANLLTSPATSAARSRAIAVALGQGFVIGRAQAPASAA